MKTDAITIQQTDKIIAYLQKLPDIELTKINSAIKTISHNRREKLNGAKKLEF